jgi:WD-40 repeat-containing protein
MAESPKRTGFFVWHFASPKVLEMKDAEVRFPLTLVFSPDGKQVAAGGMYGNVQLWDTQTGKSLASWQGS